MSRSIEDERRVAALTRRCCPDLDDVKPPVSQQLRRATAKAPNHGSVEHLNADAHAARRLCARWNSENGGADTRTGQRSADADQQDHEPENGARAPSQRTDSRSATLSGYTV